MLTVIFFQKTSQSFIDRYKTLFQPYIDDGKIDFCFWDEDGREPKDAIKGLSGIVRGIREWRALIVLPPDDDASKDDNPYLRTRDENPFDYLCNSGKDPQVKESDIPLVRLAQMLGGVPLVNHHYVIDETGKPVIAENRDLLEEYQKIWNELDSKYSLSYDAPKELYLFSARYSKKIIIPSASDDELLKRHETDGLPVLVQKPVSCYGKIPYSGLCGAWSCSFFRGCIRLLDDSTYNCTEFFIYGFAGSI